MRNYLNKVVIYKVYNSYFYCCGSNVGILYDEDLNIFLVKNMIKEVYVNFFVSVDKMVDNVKYVHEYEYILGGGEDLLFYRYDVNIRNIFNKLIKIYEYVNDKEYSGVFMKELNNFFMFFNISKIVDKNDFLKLGFSKMYNNYMNLYRYNLYKGKVEYDDEICKELFNEFRFVCGVRDILGEYADIINRYNIRDRMKDCYGNSIKNSFFVDNIENIVYNSYLIRVVNKMYENNYSGVVYYDGILLYQ